jgi:hypothetical protein
MLERTGRLDETRPNKKGTKAVRAIAIPLRSRDAAMTSRAIIGMPGVQHPHGRACFLVDVPADDI